MRRPRGRAGGRAGPARRGARGRPRAAGPAAPARWRGDGDPGPRAAARGGRGLRAGLSEVTGGNPFLLVTLLAQLAADGVAPTREAAGRLGTFGPEQVARAVERQLVRLPAGAGDLARAVAVLGPATPVRRAAASPAWTYPPPRWRRTPCGLPARGPGDGTVTGPPVDRVGAVRRHPARSPRRLSRRRRPGTGGRGCGPRGRRPAAAAQRAGERPGDGTDLAGGGERGRRPGGSAGGRRLPAPRPRGTAGAPELADIRLDLGLALAWSVQPEAYEQLAAAVEAATLAAPSQRDRAARCACPRAPRRVRPRLRGLPARPRARGRRPARPARPARGRDGHGRLAAAVDELRLPRPHRRAAIHGAGALAGERRDEVRDRGGAGPALAGVLGPCSRTASSTASPSPCWARLRPCA